VLRARHLDGRAIPAGKPLYFDLNLFLLDPSVIADLIRTFAQLAREGVGPSRKKVALTRVEVLDENGRACAALDEDASTLTEGDPPYIALTLDRPAGRVRRVRITFLTPTELKSGQQIVPVPDFRTLAARIRDRLSTLSNLYGAGPLAIDFRAFRHRAALVDTTSCDLTHFDVLRKSSRTGQVHPIGGFVGEVEYEGELAEFVPYLNAARWTGVGRQTVWGKGEIATTILDPRT
jgi:hypothetical protein